jgi:GTP cyclohydrolase FolE2
MSKFTESPIYVKADARTRKNLEALCEATERDMSKMIRFLINEAHERMVAEKKQRNGITQRGS